MSRAYITTPTLSDQHWRATLRDRSEAQREEDMEDAITRGHMWRFEMLRLTSPGHFEKASFMDLAIAQSRAAMFKTLADACPDFMKAVRRSDFPLDAARAGEREILAYLVKRGALDISSNSAMIDVLRAAAENGHAAIVDDLLALGAKASEINFYHMADIIKAGHLGIVRKLVDKGYALDDRPDRLMEGAVESGKIAIVRYLLDSGITPETLFQSALNTAAKQGYKDILQALLEWENGILNKNEAFQGAISDEQPQTAALLLAHGADINADNGEALRSVLRYSDEEGMLVFLLSSGADVNHMGNDAPLLVAIEGEKPDFAALLLAHGADHRVQNGRALTLAREGGFTALEALLQKYEATWRAKLKLENRATFEQFFPKDYTVDDLRMPVTAEGESGLMLAAKSGAFLELLQAAKGGRLQPEDLYHPPSGLDTVYSMLRDGGDLAQFFDLALWPDTQKLRRAHETLPLEVQDKVSLANSAHELHRSTLGKSGKNFKIKDPGTP